GIDRIFVATDAAGEFLKSPDSFLRMAELYSGAGITHLVVHWPRPEGVYAGDPESLHRIAEKALPIVRELY
ncbi:MAG: LLM class flavin-dependent oxidoreductase, partial [Streptomyces sp.]